MTKSMRELRDEMAKEHYDKYLPIDKQADSNGTLYIDKRFGSFCYGWDACFEIMKAKAEEILVFKILRAMDHADDMNSDNFNFCSIPIRLIIEQWREEMGE